MNDRDCKALELLRLVEVDLLRGYSALGLAWGALESASKFESAQSGCIDQVIRVSLADCCSAAARMVDKDRDAASIARLMRHVREPSNALALRECMTWEGTSEDFEERLTRALSKAEDLLSSSQSFLDKLLHLRDKYVAHTDTGGRKGDQRAFAISFGDYKSFFDSCSEVYSAFWYVTHNKHVHHEGVFDQARREFFALCRGNDLSHRYHLALSENAGSLPRSVWMTENNPIAPSDLIRILLQRRHSDD